MAKFKIYVYGKNAFFVEYGDDESNTVTFISDSIIGYTVSIDGNLFRSKGKKCRIPSDSFKSGESICRITTESGIPLLSESITNRGGVIYPSGLRNKRMVIDLIQKVKQLEIENESLTKKLQEQDIAESESDLLSI